MQNIARLRAALIAEGSLTQRVVGGSFWSLIGSTVAQGGAFAASIACAQILGKATFGELGMIRNTIAVFGTFAGLGLGLTAIKHVAEFFRTDPTKAARIIRLCTVTALISAVGMAALLAIFAPFLAADVLAAPHLTTPLVIGAILLFEYAYDGAQKGVLAGFEAYRTIARISAIGGVTTFVAVVGAARYLGLNGALLGFAVGAGIILLLNRRAIQVESGQHGIDLRAPGFWSERDILSSFSLPAFLTSAIVGPAMWVSNAILVRQPGGFSQMGNLNAANQINLLALFVPRSMLQVLLPILSVELNRGEESKVSRKLLVLNAYTAFYLTTSLVSVMLFFVPSLLMIFGPEFLEGQTAMVFVLCSLPILTYKDGIARFVQAKSLLWYGFASNLLWAAILITFTVFLVDYGAAGLALAYLLAYAIVSLVSVPLYYMKLRMGRQLLRDALFATVLTLAVIPGALTNFIAFGAATLTSLAIVTVLLIGLASWLLWRWLNE